MSNAQRQALAALAGPNPVYTCTITTVTPLTVTINGQTGISGVKMAGATYSTGTATALWWPPAAPLIWPIG